VREPADWRAFGTVLAHSLRSARERAAQDVGGFDSRCLIKLELTTAQIPTFQRISREIEIVNQEDKTVVIAFATDTASEFEARLTTLTGGRRPHTDICSSRCRASIVGRRMIAKGERSTGRLAQTKTGLPDVSWPGLTLTNGPHLAFL
jgi:hypothetical protein